MAGTTPRAWRYTLVSCGWCAPMVRRPSRANSVRSPSLATTVATSTLTSASSKYSTSAGHQSATPLPSSVTKAWPQASERSNAAVIHVRRCSARVAGSENVQHQTGSSAKASTNTSTTRSAWRRSAWRTKVPIGSARPALALFGDDGDELVDRALQVVVHHDVVGDGLADGLFVLGLAQPLDDLVLGVTTAPQAPLLLLTRRRHHEDQQRLGMAVAHLLGAVDLDLEHHVLAGRRRRERRAVVRAEEVGPLEEARGADAGLEGGTVGEDVGIVRLTGALRSCRPRPGQPQRRVPLQEGADDRSLPDSSRPRDDDDQRRSAQLLEQRLPLLRPEATHSPGLADADVLHDATGLHLADAGQRFEEGHRLELADHIVALRLAERLGQRHRSHLQLLLQLGTGGAGFGGLLKGGSTLLGAESRGIGHDQDPSAGSWSDSGAQGLRDHLGFLGTRHRSADHEEVGTSRQRALGRGHADLIVVIGSRGADAGDGSEQRGPEALGLRHVAGGAHDPGATGLEGRLDAGGEHLGAGGAVTGEDGDREGHGLREPAWGGALPQARHAGGEH